MNDAEKKAAVEFNSARQIDRYRSGPGSSNNAIPFSAEELEEKSRARLSPQYEDWINGAAGNGDAARGNVSAFSRWAIVPRMLCDVDERDFSIELFGKSHPSPLFVAPIGVQTAAHPEGELATARAAASLGIPFTLSTVATYNIEEVAGAMGNAPRWFQLYWPRCPELTSSFIKLAEDSGYEALVVTLDTQMLGWRERNLELGFLPFLEGIGLQNYFSDPVFHSRLEKSPEEDRAAAVEGYLSSFSDKSRVWENLQELRDQTDLPILLKGIQHPADAERAIQAGMDGIIVSNHGGRQVAGGVATLDVLPEISAAVGGRIPILFDSGIRRGADVFKALALGSCAVMVGRPFMWALSIGGEEGVREFFGNLLADFDLTCALAGKSRVSQIVADDLKRVF